MADTALLEKPVVGSVPSPGMTTGNLLPISPVNISSSVVAPVTATAPQVQPAIVSPTTQISEADNLAAENAKQTSNPKGFLQIAANTSNPSVAQASLHLATNLEKGKAKYDATLGKVDAAGGLQNPDGRVEYAKLWQNRDNSPQYANAFIQYVMGNSKAAKKYLSGGEVNDKVQIDTRSGEAIKYGVDENGDYHWAVNLTTGKQLTPEEFQPIVGRFGTIEQSITYLVDKANAQDWAKKFNVDYEDAKTKGAAASGLLDLYNMQDQNITGLKDISPALASEILRYSGTSIGQSLSQSRSAQAFTQATKNAGLKEGQLVSAELAGQLGIDFPKLVGATFKGNGQFQATDGSTFDIGTLTQGTAGANTTAETDKRLTASAESIMRDEKIQALLKQDPTGVLAKRFTAALDTAKSIALLEAKIGNNVFNLPTIGFGVTDEYARGRIQAQQGIFNQKANAAYAQYVEEMAKKFGSANAPRPGDLVAGFTASPTYKELLTEYKSTAKNIIQERNQYAAAPAASNLLNANPNMATPVPNEALARQLGSESTTAAPVLPAKTPKGSVAPPAPAPAPVAVPAPAPVPAPVAASAPVTAPAKPTPSKTKSPQELADDLAKQFRRR
jgi:hypothetical protein